MLKYIGLGLSITVLIINLIYFDFDLELLSSDNKIALIGIIGCLLYTSPSPRD